MYKVIEYFEDLQDNRHAYQAGDVFPREGLEVSEERLAELASDKNLRKKPLIEFVSDEGSEKLDDEQKKEKKLSKKEKKE